MFSTWGNLKVGSPMFFVVFVQTQIPS